MSAIIDVSYGVPERHTRRPRERDVKLAPRLIRPRGGVHHQQRQEDRSAPAPRVVVADMIARREIIVSPGGGLVLVERAPS
jgi:hypothetical protein